MNKLFNFSRDKNSVVENLLTDSEVLNPKTQIHNDLTSFYFVLVEELKKFSDKEYNELEWRRNELIDSERQLSEINIRPIEREIENEKAYLAKLGFSNAKSERLESLENKLVSAELNVQQTKNKIREIDSRINNIENQRITKEILLRLKKDFGEEALFVRYDDFEKVINKYNLVCGKLSDYKGVLPEYKMADINRVLTMNIPEFWEDKISKIAHAYDTLRIIEKTQFNRRFPFFVVGSIHDNVLLGYSRYATKFFIAAPAHEMLTEKELKAEREARAKDPFICAHTKWGIIIFTKWGEEAEDEVIKKYER